MISRCMIRRNLRGKHSNIAAEELSLLIDVRNKTMQGVETLVLFPHAKSAAEIYGLW